MGSASEQYIWMLGLVAAWRQQVDNDQGDPPPLLGSVYARAGTFSNAPPVAANDQPAAQLLLLFIWLWLCAKHRANFSERPQFFGIPRQIKRRAFFFHRLPETLWLCGIPANPILSRMLFHLCQINHPLTIADS